MTALRRLAESLDLPETVIDSVVRNPWTPLQITQFPAPPSPTVADMIEAQAHALREQFPYRSLLDCREVAAQLVGVVLTWDSMWPEAEGDHPFCCEYCEHNHDKVCECQPCRFIAEIGFLHADDCGWVAMQL